MPWTSDFEVDHGQRHVRLRYAGPRPPSDGKLSAYCSAAFAKVVQSCIDADLFRVLGGGHSEPYAVMGANYPVQIERFAAVLFGIVHRGAHMTVYTRRPDGELRIWVPTRNVHMKTFPGMLDTTIAGGVPAPETPWQCLVHEADEEASFPAGLVQAKARAAGVITYVQKTGPNAAGFEQGLIHPDCVYVYDMEVGDEVVPVPKDDEVKEFGLMDVETIKARLLQGDFKPNSAVVMIDFFVRHGLITPENEGDYVEIVSRMHRRLPFPLTAEHPRRSTS